MNLNIKFKMGYEGLDGRIEAERGREGVPGPQGAAGPQGIPGVTPHIGENGHWYIGEKDTEINATGPEGQRGATGPQGPAGDTGPQGAPGPKGDTGSQGPKGADGEDYVLTDSDKEQIAGIAVSLADPVQYSKQEKTESQKLQARENIGAASVSDIPKKTSELENDSGYLTQHQDITNKENKGKITIGGTEYAAARHTVTIVTNGVTTSFYIVGVS